MTTETIYLGHDNIIDLLLTADGEVVDISATTRATAQFGGIYIDSDTSLSAFDWSEGEDGILHLTFGEETILTGTYKVVITLYDPVNPDGVVWDYFRCEVVGEDAVPIPDTPPPILISQGGTGQSTAFNAFNALKQMATETYTGVVELATDAETVTGTDAVRATTPSGVTARLESPPAIGSTFPAAGNFTAGQIGDDTNYSEFLSDGKLHFTGTARPQNVVAITGAQLLPSHHNPLTLQSLTLANGITTEGMDTSPGASRRVEIQGIDGGMYVKGRIKSSYTQGDTSHLSHLVKVKLNTTNATWEQSTEWRVIIDIAIGCVTGKFTIFMPPFSLMEYSNYEMYITCDGATYFDSDHLGFAKSLAGPGATTMDLENDESAGSGVVIEVLDTSGLYDGNLVFVSDSENSEWIRIIDVVIDTSVTAVTLQNSYTVINGAKLEVFDYTKAAYTTPIQRGLMKTKTFANGENFGMEFQYAIPHDIDNEVNIGLVIQYIGTDTNVGADPSKWRVQWVLRGLFTAIDESFQYGNLVYSDVTPPSPTVNSIAVLAEISGADHAGKHVLAVQIVRLGADAGDTYSGDIRVIGVAITYTSNKLGYEL